MQLKQVFLIKLSAFDITEPANGLSFRHFIQIFLSATTSNEKNGHFISLSKCCHIVESKRCSAFTRVEIISGSSVYSRSHFVHFWELLNGRYRANSSSERVPSSWKKPQPILSCHTIIGKSRSSWLKIRFHCTIFSENPLSKHVFCWNEKQNFQIAVFLKKISWYCFGKKIESRVIPYCTDIFFKKILDQVSSNMKSITNCDPSNQFHSS